MVLLHAAVVLAAPSIIPLPMSMKPQDGAFVLKRETGIVASDETDALAKQLQRYLSATGFELPIRRRGDRNAIVLRLDKRLGRLGPEGYRLDCKKDRVDIAAPTPAGVFYGMQTLRQMLHPNVFRKTVVGGEWTIPAVLIEDMPRFGWRGAHMDVSRHFMPKEFVLKFLDLMALHKLNVFHWHLVDDNGWRLEIKRYPKLTSVGSLTDFSLMNPTGATRSINQRPEGYYTQEDVREIVQYAADRFITVMPEIELPGHALAAIKAYPKFGNRMQVLAQGGNAKPLDNWDNVFNVDDATIYFLREVFDEVLMLFPSKFIHVGGDEVSKEPWKLNKYAQDRMKAEGLKDEHELQSWFIRQFDTYLASKGRRLIGWDEILEGGLAPGAAVMSWRGMAGGIAAAKAGHDVVMAPTSHTYFDYYQSKVGEPKAIGGHLPLRRVYAFDPVPPELTAEEAKHVLGGQAQLWSEFIPHPKHMEYMAYPRFCALAEVVWSPREGRSYDEFLMRLVPHLERLKVLDVNFRPLDPPGPPPVGAWKTGEVSETYTVKEWPLVLDGPGEYSVVFAYIGGECRLDIEWAEVVEDGKVVSRDAHYGRTGGDDKDNVYRFNLKTVKPGAKYVLRANVRSDGGTDSNGEILLIKK